MKPWRSFLLLCLLLWCTTGLFARTAPNEHWGSATYAAMGNMFDSAASSMVSPWNPLTAVRYFNGGADADPSYMRNYELGSSAYQMGHQLGYAGAELGSQVGLAYGVGGLARVSAVAARGGAGIGGLSFTERSVGALQWESNQSQIRSRVLANIQANRAATLDIANGLATMDARAANKVARLDYVPTSGAVLEGQAGRTSTILGNYQMDMKHIIAEMGNVKSLDFGAKPGGFNVLNVPDNLYKTPAQFWREYNKPWLGMALQRGDNMIFTTTPKFDVLTRINPATGKVELSGFGREYLFLRQNGLGSKLSY